MKNRTPRQIWTVRRSIESQQPAIAILIRIAVGCIFLSEGIQKFLFPEQLGVGRFDKIGIPMPDILAPFVGVNEITCGILILLGLATRIAAIPLIIVMIVAIVTTKIPMLMDKGFWAMAHEGRADFAMILSLCFLVAVGAGSWSLDHLITKSKKP